MSTILTSHVNIFHIHTVPREVRRSKDRDSRGEWVVWGSSGSRKHAVNVHIRTSISIDDDYDAVFSLPKHKVNRLLGPRYHEGDWGEASPKL